MHDGREFEGTIKRDYRSDLAVVKITGESLPFAPAVAGATASATRSYLQQRAEYQRTVV